mmetsp:Transcript_93634/g.303103  ORF Transcript_93634/g.303103 Transcript_93634/m.303103 type:complete len:210 (+) Transcript_93634:4051-4680(+)
MNSFHAHPDSNSSREDDTAQSACKANDKPKDRTGKKAKTGWAPRVLSKASSSSRGSATSIRVVSGGEETPGFATPGGTRNLRRSSSQRSDSQGPPPREISMLALRVASCHRVLAPPVSSSSARLICKPPHGASASPEAEPMQSETESSRNCFKKSNSEPGRFCNCVNSSDCLGSNSGRSGSRRADPQPPSKRSSASTASSKPPSHLGKT